MKTERAKARGVARSLVSRYQGALIERSTPPVAEDQLARSGEVAALLETRQRVSRLRDQRHVPHAPALRAGDLLGGDRAAHRDDSLPHVPPAERAELALAEAGVGGHAHELG